MPDRLAALFAPRRVLVLYQGDRAPNVGHDTALQLEYASVDAAGNFASPRATFDLATVFVAEDAVLTTLREVCKQRIAKAIVAPGQVESEVSDAAHVLAAQAGIALLGPHAFGLQMPHLGLNASPMPLAVPGGIALLSQSSSLTGAMLDWAADTHVGFSLVASCGSRGDTGLAGLLDYCATDARTQAVVVYLDNIARGGQHVRRFMSALRAAASAKPVVVLKPTGRGVATEIPTVTLAQDEAVFSTALARAGAVRVYFFIQLFSALKLLTGDKPPAGRRLAVLSNSSAAARLASDWGERVRVATERVDLARHVAAAQLAPAWVTQIEQAAAHPSTDALMLLHTPQTGVDAACAAQLAQALARSGKPVVSCVLGDAQARALRSAFEAAHVPALRTPEAAVDAFGNLATFHYNQELLRQIPPPMAGSKRGDLKQAAALIAQAQVDSVDEWSGNAAHAFLRALGLPRSQSLQTVYAGAAGVHDLRIEAHTHHLFGPVLFFGAGGPSGRLIGDQASELAPLNRLLAQRLIERSRIHAELAALDGSGLLLLQLQNLLLTLSEALCEFAQLRDIVIDPLRFAQGRLRVGDVRIRLAHAAGEAVRASGDRYAHMAIHPYPGGLTQQAAMRTGNHAGVKYLLRPIRPEDAFPLQEFVRNLSDASRYMRFISHMRELSAQALVRYTQIDYDRELAFVAVMPDPDNPGGERIIGLAHWLRNRDESIAEYALAVADGYQRQGIGSTLMNALEAQARAKRLRELEGFVLTENAAMLDLMRHLGFTVEPFAADASLKRVFKAFA
jgi:acetyltransferase